MSDAKPHRTADDSEQTGASITAWVKEQMEKIETAWGTGTLEQVLALIEEGLAAVRQSRDVRLWEMLLLRRKSEVLMQMERQEEAEEATRLAAQISEKIKKLSSVNEAR